MLHAFTCCSVDQASSDASAISIHSGLDHEDDCSVGDDESDHGGQHYVLETMMAIGEMFSMRGSDIQNLIRHNHHPALYDVNHDYQGDKEALFVDMFKLFQAVIKEVLESIPIFKQAPVPSRCALVILRAANMDPKKISKQLLRRKEEVMAECHVNQFEAEAALAKVDFHVRNAISLITKEHVQLLDVVIENSSVKFREQWLSFNSNNITQASEKYNQVKDDLCCYLCSSTFGHEGTGAPVCVCSQTRCSFGICCKNCIPRYLDGRSICCGCNKKLLTSPVNLEYTHLFNFIENKNK